MSHTTNRPLLTGLWLLLATPTIAWAQAAQQAAPMDPQPTRPAAAAPAGPLAAPLADPADDPARACFATARDGGREAYACDLAVQVARDAGTPRALAAALANRSLVLARAGRLQPALEDLDEALAQTPDNADLYGNRGNLLLRLNRPVDALAAYDRAVALRPDDPVVYYNRAFGYRALGEAQRAAEDVARADRASRAPRSGAQE